MKFKLADVLLESNVRFQNYPHLYCRATCPIQPSKDNRTYELFPYAIFDFSTLFNSFSVKKWRRYTVANKISMHFEIAGKAMINFYRIDSTLAAPQRTLVGTLEFTSDDFEEQEFHFTGDEDADVLAFEIITYTFCKIRDSYYYTDVNESDVRRVELALATTTFKQEKFITANIDLFKREIFGCNEDVSKHFTMIVIDNGRTLDAEALSGDGVIVHPNKNVGGAGGFTRGMIEAMHLPCQATHVLLMDDDVQISTESLKRTYRLLSIVNDEYKEAYISGAMMSYERQNEFHEDIGWVRSDGCYGPIKCPTDLNILDNIVANETISLHKPNRYAGWWYCCIPLEVVKKVGLPLPVFIRGDDAEYGNRGAKRIISMNGICVWHLTLALKYRAHLERYMVPRNSLIAQATTGVYQDVDFMQQYKHNVQLDFKTLNYDSVELSIMALEDYLKGPEFIMQERGEEILKKTMALNEKPIDLDKIDDKRLQEVVIDPRGLYFNPERMLFARALDYMSYNGHRLPNFMINEDDLVVIPWDGWWYPSGLARNHKQILAVSRDGKQGIIRTMDKKRFKELHKRYKDVVKRYYAEKDEVAAKYAAAREKMTSEEFWRSYLEI